MKKIINDPTTVTTEALQGMAEAHADLITVTLDPAFIVRADAPGAGQGGVGVRRRQRSRAAARRIRR